MPGEIMAGNTVGLGIEQCRLLGRLAGVDATAIWQLGFLERTGTGLYLAGLGLADEARDYLDVAESWAAHGPIRVS